MLGTLGPARRDQSRDIDSDMGVSYAMRDRRYGVDMRAMRDNEAFGDIDRHAILEAGIMGRELKTEAAFKKGSSAAAWAKMKSTEDERERMRYMNALPQGIRRADGVRGDGRVASITTNFLSGMDRVQESGQPIQDVGVHVNKPGYSRSAGPANPYTRGRTLQERQAIGLGLPFLKSSKKREWAIDDGLSTGAMDEGYMPSAVKYSTSMFVDSIPVITPSGARSYTQVMGLQASNINASRNDAILVRAAKRQKGADAFSTEGGSGFSTDGRSGDGSGGWPGRIDEGELATKIAQALFNVSSASLDAMTTEARSSFDEVVRTNKDRLVNVAKAVSGSTTKFLSDVASQLNPMSKKSLTGTGASELRKLTGTGASELGKLLDDVSRSTTRWWNGPEMIRLEALEPRPNTGPHDWYFEKPEPDIKSTRFREEMANYRRTKRSDWAT